MTIEERQMTAASSRFLTAPLRQQRFQLALLRLWEPGEEAFAGVVEANFARAAAGGERGIAQSGADFGDDVVAVLTAGQQVIDFVELELALLGQSRGRHDLHRLAIDHAP